MYELERQSFGSHTRYHFYHKECGNGFSIVPAAGANVLQISFAHQHILDGYETPEALAIGKWGKSAVLFPFPNRLAGGRYTWNGKTYQFPINHAATGNAIHGFAREMAFEVQHVYLAREAASIRVSLDYDGRLAFYPFPFVLELEFSIFDDGVFQLGVSLENTGETALPFGFGWHPYFRLAGHADEHTLHLPASEQVLVGDNMIPTGERAQYNVFSKPKKVGDTVLDACFQYKKPKGKPTLALHQGGRQVKIFTPAKQFPFFQVFTPPHRESIALEPMTCNVDAFNNQQGLLTLHAGETWESTVEIQYNNV